MLLLSKDTTFGGGCACCSFNFMPNGNAGLIQSMSEFETDAANAEISALEKLPWPQELKDSIWMERVRLRQFCKGSMKEYKQFWTDHGENFEIWFLAQPIEKLRKWFQLPRQEVLERLKQQNYRFHTSFGTLLCGVIEQVAFFNITGYEVDGRGDPEIQFEKCLMFDRRGGFTLTNIESEETKRKWLLRHRTLAGPKLLDRNSKSSDNEIDDDDPDDNKRKTSTIPSFRSDRRIVRLLMSRHFADVVQRAYLKERQAATDVLD